MFHTLKGVFKKVIKADWGGLKEDALNEAIIYAKEHPENTPISAEEMKEVRRNNNKEKRGVKSEVGTLEA